jgi:hypothetical protein
MTDPQPTIVIDTNVINARQGIEAMNEIERLAEAGWIRIYKTDVLDTEMAGHYRRGTEKAALYEEDVGVGVWGLSRWGHSVWASKDDARRLTATLALLFGEKEKGEYARNDVADAMHLITAARHGREYFVTAERKLLNCAEGVFELLGVKVRDPNDCLREIRGKEAGRGR